eukprot:gene9733-8556_t
MAPCARADGACYHDFGALAPVDSVGGGATGFASRRQTYWSAAGAELAAGTRAAN